MRAAERWTQYTKQLPPLCVGDHVRFQNQIGPHPLKWDKTGRIVEVRQFDQYVVRTDGSGRTSMRNRKFLRKFVPVQKPKAKRSVAEDFRFLPTITRSTTSVPTTPPVIVVEKSSTEQTQSPRPDNLTSQNLAPPSATTDGVPPALLPDSPVTISPTPLHPCQLQSPPQESSPKPTRPPLALRRLMDYNSKELNE